MRCPDCKADELRKCGFKLTRKGHAQRYQCKKCGHVTTQPIRRDK